MLLRNLWSVPNAHKLIAEALDQFACSQGPTEPGIGWFYRKQALQLCHIRSDENADPSGLDRSGARNIRGTGIGLHEKGGLDNARRENRGAQLRGRFG